MEFLMSPHHLPKLAIALLLALLLPACGGGSSDPVGNGGQDGGENEGGGGETFNDRFAGSFHHVALAGASNDSSRISWVGSTAADGLGELVFSDTLIKDGSTLGGPAARTFSYGVEADGGTTLSAGGDDVFRGAVTDDGAFLLATTLLPGGRPSVNIIGKKETGLSVASMSGPYHIGVFGIVSAGFFTTWAVATFNGSGGWETGSFLANVHGSLDSSGADDGFYTVAEDGSATMESDGLIDGGAIYGGGQVMVLGGAISAGSGPNHLIYAIKASSDASVATLSGEYLAVGLIVQPEPTSVTSFHARVVSDGMGGLELNDITENEEGIVTTGGASTETYAVDASGRLTVGNRQGAVSADGRFAFLTGEISGGPVVMIFLVRK